MVDFMIGRGIKGFFFVLISRCIYNFLIHSRIGELFFKRRNRVLFFYIFFPFFSRIVCKFYLNNLIIFFYVCEL
jgi:hypothetical protein